MVLLVVGWRASSVQLHLVWLAAWPQTAVVGRHVPDHAANVACQTRSALFCLEEFDNLDDELDNAVALKWAQGEEFAGSSQDDPEGWIAEEVHRNGSFCVSLAVEATLKHGFCFSRYRLGSRNLVWITSTRNWDS